jgi:nitroreductase
MPDNREPLSFHPRPPEEMAARAAAFRDEMARRRSVRDFAARPVPREVIAACIETAGTAPSGANMQPWHFVVVGDPEIKHEIRVAAEREEAAFYAGRAGEQWLQDLAPLGTDASKPFLETAPYLIVVFAQTRGPTAEDGTGGQRHYYVNESVGIATGMLIAALHHAGLAVLPYTPSPMRFLRDILDRPDHERPFLVLVVGYPAADATVPAIERKPLDEIATFED